MEHFPKGTVFVFARVGIFSAIFLMAGCGSPPRTETITATRIPTHTPDVASPRPVTPSATPLPATATGLPQPTSSPSPAVLETLPPFQDLESAQMAYQNVLAQYADSEWGRLLIGLSVEGAWCRGLHELITANEVADLYNDKSVEGEFQGATELSQLGQAAFTPADATPDSLRVYYDRFLDLIDKVDAALSEWELNESMVPSGARQTMAFHCSELENLEGEVLSEALQNGAGISQADLGQVGGIAAQLFEMMGMKDK